MTDHGDNRSISITGNVIGGAVTSGDHNTVTVTYTAPPLPPAESVDPVAVVAALREVLLRLPVPEEAKKVGLLLDLVAEEVVAETPDKEEAAGTLTRIGKVVRTAADYAGQVDKIGQHVVALASWLGPLGKGVLDAFGLHL